MVSIQPAPFLTFAQSCNCQTDHTSIFFSIFELPVPYNRFFCIGWREPGWLAFAFLRTLQAKRQQEKSRNTILLFSPWAAFFTGSLSLAFPSLINPDIIAQF